jgi:hypothetical protein
MLYGQLRQALGNKKHEILQEGRLMDMWNWLQDCFDEKSLTLETLEQVMRDDKAARELWEAWAYDSDDFVHFVRDEVGPFIQYLQKRQKHDD